MLPSERRLSGAPPERMSDGSGWEHTHSMAGTSIISFTLPVETKAAISGVESASPWLAPSVARRPRRR
jgi:hypothetical protein